MTTKPVTPQDKPSDEELAYKANRTLENWVKWSAADVAAAQAELEKAEKLLKEAEKELQHGK